MFCTRLKHLTLSSISSLARKGIYREEGCEYMSTAPWNDAALVDKEK